MSHIQDSEKRIAEYKKMLEDIYKNNWLPEKEEDLISEILAAG